jgi:hypothetical protein
MIYSANSRYRLLVPVVLCALAGILAFAASPAAAFRNFQTEITEVPNGAPQPGPLGHAYKVAVYGY